MINFKKSLKDIFFILELLLLLGIKIYFIKKETIPIENELSKNGLVDIIKNKYL